MSTKHTPGPWFYTGKHDDCEVRYVGRNREDRFDMEIATLYHGKGEEQIANANLIAAAPELLEALNRLLITAECVKRQADNSGKTPYTDWRSAVDDLMKVSDKARAAIAKANGEQA